MSDTTLSYLDGYCERAGLPGLMAEPVDVISNLGFILAAWFALKAFRKQGWTLKDGWDLALLTLLLFGIGIGSGLWHGFAERWAMLWDVIPILLFINLYLLSFFLRVLRLKRPMVIGCWLLFQAANLASEALLPRGLLNGSIMYVPTWGTLALIVLYLKYKHHPATRNVAITLGIFTLSLLFRTVDMAICPIVPLGTHFLWHILNSVVLYRLLRLLIVR